MTEDRLIEIERRIASASADTVVSILMEDVPEVLAELRTYMGIFGQDTQRFLQGGGSATTHAQAKQGGDGEPRASEADRGPVQVRHPDLEVEEEVSLRRQLREASARSERSRAEGSGSTGGGGVGDRLNTPLPIEPRGTGAP